MRLDISAALAIPLTYLLVYPLIGILVGVFAGLFGIGGGALMVPALILLLTLQNLAPQVVTHMAIGSSLAVICLTSLSSAYSHHQKEAVLWRLFLWLTPGLLLGAGLGAWTASLINGEFLRRLFGGVLIAIAIRMLFESQPRSKGPLNESKLMGGGTLIGWFAALFGIGGGILTTPFLTRYQTPIKKAIGTSAAAGLPIALCGTISYAVIGWNEPLLPVSSFGYVYWPAAIGIALGSVPGARFGAKLAHRSSSKVLKKAFALFLLTIGLLLLAS